MNVALLMTCLGCGLMTEPPPHRGDIGGFSSEAWGAAIDVMNGTNLQRALLGLRAAHVKSPPNTFVNEGMALMRGQVCYPTSIAEAALLQPESEWYPGYLFSPTVVVFAFFAWCVICAWLTRWFQVRRRRWLFAAAFMSPLALVPPINEMVRHVRQEHDRVAPPVVISNDTVLREGNGPEYASTMNLPRCVECRKIGERDNWLQVEFASGLTGWVWKSDAIVSADTP